MARVQVGYDPRAEALQTTAAPNIATEQARFDPRSSSAFQLAEALGSPMAQRELTNMQEELKKKDDAAGRAYANSRPVSELRREIESGSLLPSQSPAYVAAVNHTYGENSLSGFANDTISKMNRGELTFDTPQAAEEFLVKERNKLLEGRDQFAIAGFDKRWATVRETILDANNKALDKKFVEFGVAQAADAFSTTYSAAKTEGVSGEEAAMRLMAQYDVLRATSVLATPAQQDAALRNIGKVLADDGNQDVLSRFLNQKLPNNGPSVRAKLGLDAGILEKSAEGVADKRGREEADNGLLPFRDAANSGTLDPQKFKEYWEPRQKYLGSATISALVSHNNAVIAAKARAVEELAEKQDKARDLDFAVGAATQAIVTGRPVMDSTGPSTGKTFTAQEAGTIAMERLVAANPNMSPMELIRRHAQAGIKNPQMEREISTAVLNIGEVGIDANGKAIGELLPATKEALDKFAVARQVSEPFARELAGSERNYNTLAKIQALRELGAGDVNYAASIVNQINRKQIKDFGSIQKSVAAEVEGITNPGVFTGRFWSEVFRGEFGKGEKNTLVVQNAVRELAESTIAAGLASSAKEAVEKAAAYYADPRITTQINNTIYLNKDLPELPQGMNRIEWFEKAMDNVVGAKLKDKQVKYNRSDLILKPMEGGNQAYMIMLQGQPTFEYVTKKELKDWIMTEADKRNAQDAVRGNTSLSVRRGTLPNRVPKPEERPLMNIGK